MQQTRRGRSGDGEGRAPRLRANATVLISPHPSLVGQIAMATWKLPAKAKIYEALSAIADGRVELKTDTRADVTSSDGDKAYIVMWSPDKSQTISNDNGSYYQGYLGYPIVAVLMTLGEIRFDQEVVRDLAGIQWKLINKKFKNNYDNAVEFVLDKLREKGTDVTRIRDHADLIWSELKGKEFNRLPLRIPPPTER